MIETFFCFLTEDYRRGMTQGLIGAYVPLLILLLIHVSHWRVAGLLKAVRRARRGNRLSGQRVSFFLFILRLISF